MSDDDADELVRERHGAVVVARLNRPEARNALTPMDLVTLATRTIEEILIDIDA